MKLLPVALALFHRLKGEKLEVWVQVRTDDGPYHGMLEFPGGKIEAEELPVRAAVREVDEEVGIKISPETGKLMGIYQNERSGFNILLYIFLFPDYPELTGKGEWLSIEKEHLSSKFKGMIPPPNHQIIDDLYCYLFDLPKVSP